MRAMRGRGSLLSSHPSPPTNWRRVLADADRALEEVAVKHGLRAEVVRRKYNMSCLRFGESKCSSLENSFDEDHLVVTLPIVSAPETRQLLHSQSPLQMSLPLTHPPSMQMPPPHQPSMQSLIHAHELLYSQSPLLTSSPSKHPPSPQMQPPHPPSTQMQPPPVKYNQSAPLGRGVLVSGHMLSSNRQKLYGGRPAQTRNAVNDVPPLLDRQAGSSPARNREDYSCDIEAALAGMVPDDENEDTKQRKGRKGSAMFSSRVVVPTANRARIKGATDYARQQKPRVTQRDGRAMAFLIDFESLEHFWVLLDVSSEFRSFSTSPELEPITTDNVCAGQPCMARSHTSQNDWDRGRIVFVDQLRGFVNVRLVDSGQLLESIRIDDVKSVSNVDAEVPPVAYRCHLSRPDLEPVIEAYTTAMKKTAGGRPLPPILTKDAKIEVEFDLQAEPRLAENEQEDWPVVNIWYNKRELRTILIEAEAEQQLRIAACQPPPRAQPSPSSSYTQICPSVVIGKPTITRISKATPKPIKDDTPKLDRRRRTSVSSDDDNYDEPQRASDEGGDSLKTESKEPASGQRSSLARNPTVTVGIPKITRLNAKPSVNEECWNDDGGLTGGGAATFKKSKEPASGQRSSLAANLTVTVGIPKITRLKAKPSVNEEYWDDDGGLTGGGAATFTNMLEVEDIVSVGEKPTKGHLVADGGESSDESLSEQAR